MYIKDNKKKNRLKVILVQLNGPSITSIIPLAAGYLKAMVYKAGLFKYVDIEILNRDINFAGDSNIISYILERCPDVIGFSCYVWNQERTIYIINQIKTKMAKIKIICGGTQISSAPKIIMRNKNIDIVVIGEGELTFVELLKNFLFHKPKLGQIKGIAFRQNRKIIVTPGREQIPDINVVPSPYLLGFIDPVEYDRLFIETYRGCISRCSFCNWGRNFQGIRNFSVERIKNEMKLALNKGVRKCEIIDTIFNLPANLSRIAKVVKEIDYDNDKSIVLSVEGRAEYVNSRTIKLLSQCNVKSIGIGLQSTNKIALNNVSRWFDKELFLRGVNLLKKAGISFRIDLIIGLPGDTIISLKNTLKFVKRIKNNRPNYLEILRVSPDTELKKKANYFNLKYLKRIPYYVLSTNELSNADFKKIWVLYNKQLRHEDVKISHSFFLSPLLGYGQDNNVIVKTKDTGSLISYIALEIDSSKQGIKQVKNLAIEWGRTITLNPHIFFKCIQPEYNYHLIREFLYQISKTNPYSRFCIFIENSTPVNLGIFKKSVVHKLDYKEYRLNFYQDLFDERHLEKFDMFIIHPFSKENLRYYKDKVSHNIRVLWSISISENIDWRKMLLKLLNTPYGDLLVNFNSNNLSFIIKVLKYIYRYRKNNKSVFFSDYALQLFYNEILINRESPQCIIKGFKHIFAFTPFKISYVDRCFNESIGRYSISRCFFKFIDIANIYKNNTRS
ncbi:MAG: B12-binding domain-containing radical SAM protein [Candidatus Omnitrophica bacterium]|nr:B12-binding domain-containing radical SAM protein [Candidatus Omnitrophota bacterium]